MEQSDPLPSSPSYPVPAVAEPARAARALAVPAGLRLLWRYRAWIAGMIALALAVWGEALLRPVGDGPGADAALGTRLLQVAVLLVGLVAWVRDGVRLGWPWRTAQPAPAEPPRRVVVVDTPHEPAPAASIAPAGRLATTRLGRSLYQAKSLIAHRSSLIAQARRRAGWRGTVLGLAVVAALAGWCGLLLQQSFADQRAPWVWAALLLALVGTFAGVGSWPKGASLVAHDPAEPAQEPPVSRGEWLALGVILLVAIVVRVWSLETIPFALYPDEGDRLIDARHLLRGEPVNQAPFVFFGTGWWGVPSLYFWVVAQALKLFGTTLAGGRLLHALAGIGAVWCTYRTGRVAWSPRAGLLAAALVAASDFAIHFSRIAGESSILVFTWAACFYFLYKALKTRRPLDWVLCGLAGGFSLYGYVAGKLLPVVLGLVALYVLGRWGLTGLRRYGPGLALAALAAGLTFLPNGLFALANPNTFSARFNSVSIFSPPVSALTFAQYNSDSWLVVLQRQFMETFRVFDVGFERGPFYPTGQPLLPTLWAAIFVLGVGYLVWRVGDVRFFLLGVWLLGGLAGAALTNGTPTVQRLAALVPLLGLIPAVFLDRLAGSAPPLRWRAPLRSRRGLLRGTMQALLAGLVVLLGLQTLVFYFLVYTPRDPYGELSRAGRYVATLDPQKDTVLQAALPNFWWWLGPAVWLGDQVPARDFGNASDELPIVTDDERTVHILVFDSNAQYMPILEEFYPGGTTVPITRPDGTLYCTAYKIPPAALAARRQTMARYGPPAGPLFERAEPRLGTAAPDDRPDPALAPPAWMPYPLAAEWHGGVMAPDYATYRFSVLAPAGATLEIDGRPVLTAPPNSLAPSEARLVLAKGMHQVRLAGTLADAQGQVALRWGSAEGALVPVPRRFLWNGPLGAWLGESQPGPPEQGFTAPTLPTAPPPLVARRDSLLAWRGINLDLKGGSNVFVAWRAILHAPTSGNYLLDPVHDGSLGLWIDGKLVGGGGVGAGAGGLPAQVDLTAGDHALEVRYQAMHDNAGFEFYWQPPNEPRTLLPPAALAPAPGGAWTDAERPGVPGVDGVLIGATAPAVRVALAHAIDSYPPWEAARGVAVLPDGRVAVGDSGRHQIVVYRPNGSLDRAWGTDGQGDGAFNLISDLAANPDGTLAVLDADNGDIQLYTGDGQLLAHLSHATLGLSHASGLAWGPDGTLWIADTGASRVIHADRAGQLLGTFHAAVGPLAPLEQPLDVVVTPDNVVYVVDFHNRIARLNAAGLVDHEWTLPIGGTRGGSHLALWHTLLVVTNPDTNTLRFLDLPIGQLRSFAPATAEAIPFQLPIGVAASFDGQLYVLDSATSRVLVLEQR